MKMLKISLHTGFLFLFFACVVSAENYNALIFDRIKRSLIEIPSEIAEYEKCGKWASACPAKDDDVDEKEFNEERSFYKNALFVRDIYDGENLTDLKLKICDKPFQLSVVLFDEKPLHYEIGYEIYHQSSGSQEYATCNKTKYLSVDKTLTKMASLEYLEKRSNLKPFTKTDKEKDFLWLPLFRVRFMNGNLQRIEYEIRKNNRNPTMQCQNFDLAKEIFNNIDVDEFYSEEAEENVFRGVEIPEGLCTSKFRCFEKVLLIPADQFQFGSSQLPICSNMTTIPIWSNLVKDVLKRVDQYLYTLSRLSGTPLRVIAGVHDSLQFKTKRTNQKKYIILKSKTQNLQSLRVSSIIYKLVKFKINNTCKNEDPGCWHGVLIVIHNNPKFTNDSEKICEERSIQLGWGSMVYKDSDTGGRYENIYICAITKSSMEGVGLKYDEKLPISELSLKKFPYNVNKELIYKNFEDIIFEELEKEPKREFDDDTETVRPLIYDDNFSVDSSDVMAELSLEAMQDDEINYEYNIMNGQKIDSVGLKTVNKEGKK